MRRIAAKTPRSIQASLALGLTLAVLGCGRAAPPVGGTDEPATALRTDSEKTGEAIYGRENCSRCHTLFDRPRGGGPTTLRGGSAPESIGSRVGPDLGLEGHRRSDEWQYAHLYAPSALMAGSRMPASRHLFRPEAGRPVPTNEAVELVAYLQALGRARRDVWAEARRREPAVPPPPHADDTLVRRGEELYREHCAACHGPDGDGRGVMAGFFTFAPRDLVAARHRFRS